MPCNTRNIACTRLLIRCREKQGTEGVTTGSMDLAAILSQWQNWHQLKPTSIPWQCWARFTPMRKRVISSMMELQASVGEAGLQFGRAVPREPQLAKLQTNKANLRSQFTLLRKVGGAQTLSPEEPARSECSIELSRSHQVIHYTRSVSHWLQYGPCHYNVIINDITWCCHLPVFCPIWCLDDNQFEIC